MDLNIFRGCLPALMTPCTTNGAPDHDLLVQHAEQLLESGMSGVIYCGSMAKILPP